MDLYLDDPHLLTSRSEKHVTPGYAPAVGQLASRKLDEDLIHFYRISLRHSDRAHFSGHGRGDLGLHFHGFEDHEKVIGLDLLAGLHVDLEDDTCDRTAADFLLRYFGLTGSSCLLDGRRR
jgi:hypothetical protein